MNLPTSDFGGNTITVKRFAGICALAMVNLFCPTMSYAADDTALQIDVPSMQEEAVSAELVHQYTGPWEFFVGGGVASFDCNADRKPDLFIAGGTNPAQLFVNHSEPGGALAFTHQTITIPAQVLKNVVGAYPVNIDNDAYTDIVVLSVGENQILKGGPHCTFSLANGPFSFDGSDAWTTAFSAIWENDNPFPTLAFGNYVNRAAEGSPWGTCHANRLLRSSTKEHATPRYNHPILLEPGYCALSMVFTDWNNSGQFALRIANDRQYYRGGQEQLWNIQSSSEPWEYKPANGWKKLKIWGMGIAQSDLDGDGKPEYALSSMGDSKLQVLDNKAMQSQPSYHDMAFEKHTTAHRPYTGGDIKPSTGWHVQFADFNNDTNQDLFIAKGNVEAMPEAAGFDPDNLLLGTSDGKFHEHGLEAGIAINRKGRGAVVEDFNADGMLDLLVVNRSSNVSLFRNRGQKTEDGYRPLGNWLSIELDNGNINTNAIGAKISVITPSGKQTKTIQIGGGHASGQVGFVHFGLGSAKQATIRIQWPNGENSLDYTARANSFVSILKNAADLSYLPFGR